MFLQWLMAVNFELVGSLLIIKLDGVTVITNLILCFQNPQELQIVHTGMTLIRLQSCLHNPYLCITGYLQKIQHGKRRVNTLSIMGTI